MVPRSTTSCLVCHKRTQSYRFLQLHMTPVHLHRPTRYTLEQSLPHATFLKKWDNISCGGNTLRVTFLWLCHFKYELLVVLVISEELISGLIPSSFEPAGKTIKCRSLNATVYGKKDGALNTTRVVI
jgi:hypothetical protein